MGYAARANGTAGKHAIFGKTPQRLRRIARMVPNREALEKLLASLPESHREVARAQLEPLVPPKRPKE